MNYEGYVGWNDHYGEIFIGEHIGNDSYFFYAPPTSSYDEDYHCTILNFCFNDLVLKGFINLTESNGSFVDGFEPIKYIGLNYTKETKLYIGSPTGKKKLKTYENGWSTMETLNMLRVKPCDVLLHGFAFDNGVFADFKKGLPFNEKKFLEKLYELIDNTMYPDFIVLPDIIGGELKSLKYSIDFLKRIGEIPFKKYLVVQNGMDIIDVEPYLCRTLNKDKVEVDGIFVGGTPTFKGFGKKQTKEIEWKLQTMEAWTKLAHKYGKKCHIGRVSSIRRLNFARSIGADSCDTSIVNFSPKSFKMYEEASKQQIIQF